MESVKVSGCQKYNGFGTSHLDPTSRPIRGNPLRRRNGQLLALDTAAPGGAVRTYTPAGGVVCLLVGDGVMGGVLADALGSW